MFNLKGQGQQTKSSHEVDASHHQYLQNAFTTVLAKQIVDNEDLLRDAMQQQREFEEERQQQVKSKRSDVGSSGEMSFSDDDDDDISFSDDDELFARLHLQRKQQMATQNEEILSMKAKGHSTYDLITQSEFLPIVTSSDHPHCIVHFFHDDFERCKIVDKHLALLAPQYLPVKFARIDANKTPFFVDKLKISVLPTIVLFKDGKVVDRIVGFEELGGKDDFSTKEFELRLRASGIMTQLKCHANSAKSLAEDERRNQNGGKVFIVGGKFGQHIDDSDDSS